MDSSSPFTFSKPGFPLVFLFLFLIYQFSCALSYAETCDSLFRCGNITAGFPFWGGNRPPDCGHPGLNLECEKSSEKTIFHFFDVSYYVLQMNNKDNNTTLKLAYKDPFHFLCPPPEENTKFFSSFFDHCPGYKNQTIFYRCNHQPNFTCSRDEAGSVSHKPADDYRFCKHVVNVTVPSSFVLEKESQDLNKLKDVLNDGFWVKLKTEYPKNRKNVDERHALCSVSFDCADKKNLSYPFWIPGREDCGHPAFELNCSGDSPEINFSSVNFRILDVRFELQTLRLVRTDYVDNLCPHNPVNTTFNQSFFSLPPSTELLTLYYNCSDFSPRIRPTRYFGDLGCDSEKESSYYVTRNPSSPLLASMGATLDDLKGVCRRNITIPADESALTTLENDLSQENLEKALDLGFGLQWDADDGKCADCKRSKGACGYSRESKEFVCYCQDKPHKLTCGSSGLTSNAIIGVSVAGGVVAVMLLAGSLWLYIHRRRQRMVDQYRRKDLVMTPPSSKETTTTTTTTSSSSTTVSRSMYSVPSSKLDVAGVQVFSYAELEEATENFSRELGDGGFGTVYHGVLKDGRAVAVKRLYENTLKRVEQFKNEIEILKSLKHPNLVILYGCTSRHSRELLLVYEFIPNGTLADHLHGERSKNHFLSWPVRLNIAIETASALCYLHVSGIIHRDVKTTNILLDNNFQVKVADFGLSRLFPTDVTHISTAPQGTPGYVDPEYYQCYRLNEKSDVYSFGVVLAELISSKEAVDITRHRHDINLANMAITRIQNNDLQEFIDPNLGFKEDLSVKRMVMSMAELVFRCLQQEREVRPSMEEVVETLRVIKKEQILCKPPEVVDINGGMGETGLLRNNNAPPPPSPETDKCASSSNSNATTASSF